MGGLGQVTAGHASPCWGKHHLRFPRDEDRGLGAGVSQRRLGSSSPNPQTPIAPACRAVAPIGPGHGWLWLCPWCCTQGGPRAGPGPAGHPGSSEHTEASFEPLSHCFSKINFQGRGLRTRKRRRREAGIERRKFSSLHDETFCL